MVDLTSPALSARDVIEALSLAPHPEGGHYRETWRDQPAGGGRGAASMPTNSGSGRRAVRLH